MRIILLGIYFATITIPLFAGDTHFGTSANPKSGAMTIKILDSSYQIFLDAPGVEWKKFPTGELEVLKFTSLDCYYQVYFYSLRESGKNEQIKLTQKYRLKGHQLVLHDKSQMFDTSGNLICEMNYNDGIFEGEQKFYNQFGIITEERYYEFGFPVKRWITRYDDGKTSMTVNFPESVADWEKTYKADHTKDKSLLGLGYKRPLRIEEKWYNPEGYLQKELAYQGVMLNGKLEILSLPETKSYDRYGNVVNATRKDGQTLIRSSWITRYGTCQEIESVWIGDELFKNRIELLKQTE
jgi:hypothetical protein